MLVVWMIAKKVEVGGDHLLSLYSLAREPVLAGPLVRAAYTRLDSQQVRVVWKKPMSSGLLCSPEAEPRGAFHLSGHRAREAQQGSFYTTTYYRILAYRPPFDLLTFGAQA